MQFKRAKLKNGLTVLFEERDVPVSTVMLATRFGAAYEDEHEKGIAHFIEHLCFKGTEKRDTKEIASEIEKVGGVLNAFTHEELTAYHVKIPSEKVDVAMDVIFDVFFNPQFPEQEVKREAQVVCEEIKMYKDHPRAFVMDKLKSCLYESPFGMFIGGTEESVKSFNREKVLEFHRRIYVPSNSILCVVGKNNFEEIVKLAEKHSVDRKFGGVSERKPKMKKDIFKEKRPGIEQANIAIGFHFPLGSSKERYAAEVFNAIFGEGMSSKLFIEVREKRGLAYAVKTDLDLGSEYGYLIIYIGTDKSKIEEVIKISVEEFHKMKDIAEAELEEAKEQLIGNAKVESEGSSETAVNLITEELVGKAEDYYSFEESVRKVKLKDIQKLAQIKDYSYCVLSP